MACTSPATTASESSCSWYRRSASSASCAAVVPGAGSGCVNGRCSSRAACLVVAATSRSNATRASASASTSASTPASTSASASHAASRCSSPALAATTPGRAGSSATAHAATSPLSASTPAGVGGSIPASGVVRSPSRSPVEVEVPPPGLFMLRFLPRSPRPIFKSRTSPSGLEGSQSLDTSATSAESAADALAGDVASSASASRITSSASRRRSFPANSGEALAADASDAAAAVP
mmetsp:Transcript_8157/g.32975  ORF Transcript_8157/g.32975 Transcript_8157/m.32975 type:complete len:236 (-) Transcript_8157:1109-1816(-)